MPVAACATCQRFFSLSLTPEEHPIDGIEPSCWAKAWRWCPRCEVAHCSDCASRAGGACPRCGTRVENPSEELFDKLYFVLRDPIVAAPDAHARTWREDLRLAIGEGVPLLEGATLGAEGLPELTERSTWRLYAHWLAVRLGVARAETVSLQGAWVQVFWEDGAVLIDVPGTQAGCMLGSLDPYGPNALPSGRWARPSREDCLAFALRGSTSWSHDFDASLVRLQELERASREVRAAPDARTRTWVEDLTLARASGVPLLPRAVLRGDGLPDLANPGTWERYARWLAVRLWMASPKIVLQRGAHVRMDPEGTVIQVEVPRLQASAELGWDDPYGPRLAGRTGRWAAPSAEDEMAFALRCAGAWKEGPKHWLQQLEQMEEERAKVN